MVPPARPFPSDLRGAAGTGAYQGSATLLSNFGSSRTSVVAVKLYGIPPTATGSRIRSPMAGKGSTQVRLPRSTNAPTRRTQLATNTPSAVCCISGGAGNTEIRKYGEDHLAQKYGKYSYFSNRTVVFPKPHGRFPKYARSISEMRTVDFLNRTVGF